MTILTWTIAFYGNKLSWRERGSDLEMEEDSKNITGVKKYLILKVGVWSWFWETQRGASMVSSRSAVSLLHTDLQVENLQRRKRVFHQCQAEWHCSFPSVSCCWLSFSSPTSQLLSLLQSFLPVRCQPLYTSCCTTVVFKVLSCKVKNVLFLCLSLCIICVKAIINLLQCSIYIPDCISWVPRLTLLD